MFNATRKVGCGGTTHPGFSSDQAPGLLTTFVVSRPVRRWHNTTAPQLRHTLGTTVETGHKGSLGKKLLGCTPIFHHSRLFTHWAAATGRDRDSSPQGRDRPRPAATGRDRPRPAFCASPIPSSYILANGCWQNQNLIRGCRGPHWEICFNDTSFGRDWAPNVPKFECQPALSASG